MNKTKKILLLLLSMLMCLMFAFTMVACDFGGGGDGEGETPDTPSNPDEPGHTCEYTEVVAYFDVANSRFPKTLKCSCGETSDRTNIEIHTAEEYGYLTQIFSQASPNTFGKYTFEFKADIDFENATITPMYIFEEEYGTRYNFIAGAEGVTLSNFTIAGDSAGNAGLFSVVKSDVTVKNINIDNATIGSNATKCAGGFIGKIDFEAEPMGSGVNVVVIENCSVKNSTITATNANAVGAGGIYGVAINDLGSERQVRIDNVEINNVDVTCKSAAGGLLGKASICAPVQELKVSVDNFSIKNCDITSNTTNEAGLYAGILGDGYLSFDIQSSLSGGRIENVNVNGQDFSNIGRDYGRTGWTDQNNCGECWTATTPVSWNLATH